MNAGIFFHKKLVLFFSFFLCVVLSSEANTVSAVGSRQWENVATLDSVMLTVESKVCLLQIDVPTDFDGTFTMLNAIEKKWCTVDSKVDEIDVLLGNVLINSQNLESKIDVVDSLIQSANDTLSIIRVDDFGGTWTVIEGVQSTLCGKFDTVFNDLTVIDQKVDLISGAQFEAFFGTCTMIESISDNVAINMSLVCELAIETASDIDSIDSLIDMLHDQNSTVCSKLDIIDVKAKIDFSGTFTALAAVEDKVCSLEEQACSLIDLVSTDTAVQALLDKACTIDSKVDELEETLISICDSLETIESFIDPIDVKLVVVDNNVDSLLTKATNINIEVTSINNIIVTTESKVDFIDPEFQSAESKLCIIDSNVDLFNCSLLTLESKVDVSSSFIQIVDSKLDSINSQVDFSLSKVCTIDSKIMLIDSSIETIESQLDTLDVLESKIEKVDQLFGNALSKTCILESKVDVVNDELDVVNVQALVIDSKVCLLCPSIDEIGSKIDITQLQVATLESKVDISGLSLQTIFSKICTLDSKVDVIEMETQMEQEGVNSIESALCILIDDFQETWTILNTIELKACTIDSLLDSIESKVSDLVEFGPDTSTTFTALEALEEKVCSVESVLDVMSVDLEMPDVVGTFTALEFLLDKSCTIDSKVDVVNMLLLTDDSSLAQAVDCLGTEITSADIGTTGFTINTSGRYFLGAEIDYAASIAANPAITISADNVTLDLCDKTLRQSNAQASTVGILVSGNLENVIIQNGTIREFTSDCIQIASEASGMILQNLRIIDSGDDGIDFVGTAVSVMINRVLVSSSGNHGLEVLEGIDITVQDSMFVDNTASGISIDTDTLTTQRVCLLRCMINNNGNRGINLVGVDGALRRVIIDSCCFFNNSAEGININQLQDSVIKGNVISSNGDAGIRMRQTVSNIEISDNVISNNIADGIFISNTNAEDCSIQGNILVANGAQNYQENTDCGPHTVLSNFAISAAEVDNYSIGGGTTPTTINKAIIDQGAGTFSTTPGRWRNISMTT